MTDGEKDTFEAVYEKKDDTYVCTADKETLETLDDELLTPIVLTYRMANMSETDFKNTIAEALEQNPQNQITKESLDEMSIEEIGQMMQMELTTYEAENDDGEMVTYVDMRPMMKQLIASGAMTQDGIAQSREYMENMIDSVGSSTLHAMGTAYATSCDEKAGLDVEHIQKNYLWSEVGKMAAMSLLMLAVAVVVGYLASGAHMEWIIVMAVLVISGLVMVLMSITLPKFKIMQKLVDALNLVSREILTGLSVIRAFGREKKEEERFDEANRNLTRTQLFTNRVMTFMMPGMMFIMYGVTILIVWVSAHRIDAGQLQVGAMTAFITYTMQIVMAFLMLTMMSIMLPRAGVAADRIDEVITTNSSIIEKAEKETIEKHTGKVEFHHVNFRYPGADEDVLEDIDFTAEPGKTTAIIGSTGCGKSTLVNLIPRFYDVTAGKITLDGVDIRNLSLAELRDEIGFVPQKGILFSGTIASNLKFGRPEATEAEMTEAAEIAQATEFINEKPEKYDSGIAQGGTNVSGGQKQRLSIARAIAKNPNVYIFDDSFSALDMKTDAALRKALESKTKESSVIIVAQRISTILHADQILVLDEGKIVGKGTHEELLRDCEVYQQIAQSQLSAKELGLEEGKEEK